MSSTQTYINGKDCAAYVDGTLYSEKSEESKRPEPIQKSEEAESTHSLPRTVLTAAPTPGEIAAVAPMEMSEENAELWLRFLDWASR